MPIHQVKDQTGSFQADLIRIFVDYSTKELVFTVGEQSPGTRFSLVLTDGSGNRLKDASGNLVYLTIKRNKGKSSVEYIVGQGSISPGELERFGPIGNLDLRDLRVITGQDLYAHPDPIILEWNTSEGTPEVFLIANNY